MKNISQAHEALSLIFQRDGVLPAHVVDGSKEIIEGKLQSKLKCEGCKFKHTEPYYPWSNTVEGSIYELKKGAGQKTIKP